MNLGLGKTVQVLAFLSALYRKTGSVSENEEMRCVVEGEVTVSPSLIICPSSVLANWEQEIKTWANFITKECNLARIICTVLFRPDPTLQTKKGS